MLHGYIGTLRSIIRGHHQDVKFNDYDPTVQCDALITAVTTPIMPPIPI